MLILVAVIVRVALDSGLFRHAKSAVGKWDEAQKEELDIPNKIKFPTTEEELGSEDIYVSQNGNVLSFYSKDETARANADMEEHYYGNIKGQEFWYQGNITPWQSEPIQKIQIADKIAPISMSYWFLNLG